MSNSIVVCIGTSVAALATLLAVWSTVRRTTLAAVWAWHFAAVAVLGSSSVWLLAGGAPRVESTQPFQFAAAIILFCPQMALLGARRPQDGPWPLLTATFWGILALPALEAIIMHPGRVVAIRDLRGALLWLLIVVEVVNRLGTRAWLGGIFFAITQFVLLAEHLPWVRLPLTPWAWQAAPALWFLGTVGLVWPMAFPARGATWDRWWLDFRDCFGLLWSLRLAERLNADATRNRWPTHLAWSGVRRNESDKQVSIEATIDDWRIPYQQAFTNLLRRFVSEEWIGDRGGSPAKWRAGE